MASLYYRKNDGEFIGLENLINELSCFSIGFTDYTYIYYGRHLYQNAQLSQELNAILSVFEVCDKIRCVKSEKGDGYGMANVDFVEDCMFHIVENILFKDADYLICDDMGSEWADHIAIKDNTISFVHSKCKKEKGLSASSFQEIIGQAIKNIGNLTPSDSILDAKKDKLSGFWNNTQIKRCRKGGAMEFINRFKDLKKNPNINKEVCLSINFISKSQLEREFSKMQANEQTVLRSNVGQMIWLLNGFISICKERDLHCRIFCMP